jgi:hypothetical protein
VDTSTVARSVYNVPAQEIKRWRRLPQLMRREQTEKRQRIWRTSAGVVWKRGTASVSSEEIVSEEIVRNLI